MQRQMREDQLDEKSDTLCGRKRTFKNTKIGKASNSTKKQVMTDKDAYTLIVPESIQNFKALKNSQVQDDLASKVSRLELVWERFKFIFGLKSQI